MIIIIVTAVETSNLTEIHKFHVSPNGIKVIGVARGRALVADSWEHGNEPSGSYKRLKFLNN
jgi:hypothetical protein